MQSQPDDGGGAPPDADAALNPPPDADAASNPPPDADAAPNPPPDADAAPNPWWCETNGTALTTVPPPPIPSPRPMKVRYRVPIIDFYGAVSGSNMPVPSPTIIACGLTDPDCTISPKMPTVTSPTPTLPQFQIDLPYGFDGFIRINATGYIQTDYYFSGPLVGTPAGTTDPSDGTLLIQGNFIAPITEVAAQPFYAMLGTPRDPMKGLIGPRLLDCNGTRAANVTLQVASPTGHGFTLLGNLPFFSDPPHYTDMRAVSGYVNMTPGSYLVNASTPDGGHYYYDYVAVVKKNTLTVFELRTDNAHVLGR